MNEMTPHLGAVFWQGYEKSCRETGREPIARSQRTGSLYMQHERTHIIWDQKGLTLPTMRHIIDFGSKETGKLLQVKDSVIGEYAICHEYIDQPFVMENLQSLATFTILNSQ